MNKIGRDGAPGKPGIGSWTDETLPMGLRRELLDRELQNLIARKNLGQAVTGPCGGGRATNAPRPPTRGFGSERAS